MALVGNKTKVTRIISEGLGPDPPRWADSSVHPLCLQGAKAYGWKKDSCFIATAACGEQAPEIVTLRQFRDRYLARYMVGRASIVVYERVSPPLAVIIAERPLLRKLARWLIVVPAATVARKVVRRII